jgi:hypothetical protein
MISCGRQNQIQFICTNVGRGWDYQDVFSFDKLNGAMSSRYHVYIYPKYTGPPQVPNHSTSTKGISANTNFSNIDPDPGIEEKQNTEFMGFHSMLSELEE